MCILGEIAGTLGMIPEAGGIFQVGIADSLRTWLEMSGGRQDRDARGFHSGKEKGIEKGTAEGTRGTFP